MDGILICTAILIAIALLRLRGQESDSPAYAPVRVDTDENISTGAIYDSGLVMHESPFLSSDDDWPNSNASDESSISIGYESGNHVDTSRWTDSTYAYELDNIWHGTLIDPTYHEDSSSSFDDSCSSLFDDSFSSSSSCDDTFGSSLSDDSWSSSSFDDSFSSSSSFDD